MKNLVLIGLPGSGKTTLGKLLAQKLGREFIDLDEYIVKSQGQTIDSIFRLMGENAFRELETLAAIKAADGEGRIISAGGGIVLNNANMKALAKNGIIIFLDKSPKLIAQQIETKHRPLLKEGANRVFELHKQRLHLYEKFGDFKVKNNAGISFALSELLKIAGLESEENKTFAVIGSPIGHSLSPDIHLPVLNKFYNNPIYTREEIHPQELGEWVKRVKAENIAGFNITMPHKIKIIPYLDATDGEAALLNSVNTVVNRNGVLWGYNTDGEGFTTAINKQGYTLKGSRITILGTGGVAATIGLKAAKEGAKELNIIGRDLKKAEFIAHKAQLIYKDTQINAALWEDNTLIDYCSKTDIFINATPLGMTGVDEDFKDFRFISTLPKDALICDLIYSPAITKLMSEGKRQGIKTLGGLPMLVYQALLADRLYLPGEMLLNTAYKLAIDGLKERGISI